MLPVDAPDLNEPQQPTPSLSGRRRRRSPPRNYLARSEQRRLFWIVMPPAAVAILIGTWLERRFRAPSTDDDGPVQVDTVLHDTADRPGLEGLIDPAMPPGPPDAVLIEPVDTGAPPSEAMELGANPRALAAVRDDTVFREADAEAWFGLLETLRSTDPASLRASHPRDVGFNELFVQPESFRGRLVRFRGWIRRLEWLAAPSNTSNIEGYWQAWVRPQDGPPSPIVVYFLEIPDAWKATVSRQSAAVDIDLAVEVIGYFFKRWAYRATDAIRTAPLVVAASPVPLSKPSTRPTSNWLGLVIVSLMAGVSALIAILLWLVNRGTPARRRPSTAVRIGMLGAALLMPPPGNALLAADETNPATAAAAAESGGEGAPQEQAGSVEAYLGRFGLGEDVRAPLEAGGPWSGSMQSLTLRLLSRLETAPRSSMARWRAAAVEPESVEKPAAGGRPDGGGHGLVRVAGRAVRIDRIMLPEAEATIHDRKAFDLVRIVTDQGVALDVITSAAPEAWLDRRPLDERTEAVGLRVGPGPIWRQTSTDTPSSALVVAPTIAWYPATPLGALGMDYSLFDGVVDGRGLEASEADAFYAVLAAAGRSKPAALRSAAAESTPDIVALIDPSRKWIASHRGEPVTVSGVARRAIRVAIDTPERRRQIGADHYWELFVFTDTPLLDIDGRMQDSYPVVCCVRSLPEGMPRGEQMTERVDVAGFAFKRYRYRGAEQGIERESPLLIGSLATWHPTPAAEKEGGILGWILGGLAILTATLLAGFAWLMARETRRADRDHTRGLPERFEPPKAS